MKPVVRVSILRCAPEHFVGRGLFVQSALRSILLKPAVQLVSQVLPPSPEKACSQWPPLIQVSRRRASRSTKTGSTDGSSLQPRRSI